MRDIPINEMSVERLRVELQSSINANRLLSTKAKALETSIDGFWDGLWNRWDMESREEVEKDTKESWTEGTSPLNVALHYIWKREPKIKGLVEALESIVTNNGLMCIDIATKALNRYKGKK